MESSGSVLAGLGKAGCDPTFQRKEGGVRSLWLEEGVASGLNRVGKIFPSGSQFGEDQVS